MQLVDNWRLVWRFYSVHAMAIAAAIPVAYANLPQGWADYFPAWAMATLTAAVLVCGIVGRVVQQYTPPKG